MNEIKEKSVPDVVEEYKKFVSGQQKRVQDKKRKLIKEVKDLKWK